VKTPLLYSKCSLFAEVLEVIRLANIYAIHKMSPTNQVVIILSAWHGFGIDGAAATDEDSLAKAMRRKAETNLDFSGTVKSSKSFFNNPNTAYGF
jgi:hypothetical protein